MILSKKKMKDPILCLEWAKDDTYLMMGDNSGKFLIWNMLNDKISFEYPAYTGKFNQLYIYLYIINYIIKFYFKILLQALYNA